MSPNYLEHKSIELGKNPESQKLWLDGGGGFLAEGGENAVIVGWTIFRSSWWEVNC